MGAPGCGAWHPHPAKNGGTRAEAERKSVPCCFLASSSGSVLVWRGLGSVVHDSVAIGIAAIAVDASIEVPKRVVPEC
jgi:hypothetical protein